VQERGWSTPIAVGGVVGRWDQVVGDEVAAHCQPETFEEKVLTVRTDSTAWATQMRLLAPTILQRLADELGPGVVDRLVVRGPSGPSWRRGPRIVHGGRGPRDTYG
jgi:predicted nucleic acid-binding Zn ribbon protein